MTEEAKEYWTMDELVAMTDEVQTAEIEHHGKYLNIQWCELVESEEPKFIINDDMSEEDKNSYYQQLGKDRCLKMVLKANEKNSENTVLTQDTWDLLPSTLKYKVQNKILGATVTGEEGLDFQSG